MGWSVVSDYGISWSHSRFASPFVMKTITRFHIELQDSTINGIIITLNEGLPFGERLFI